MSRSLVTKFLVFFLTLASLVLTSGIGAVEAASIPMYDQSVSRTRFINDPSFSPLTLYLSSPVYVHLNGQSVSTPTITGSMLYQYTFTGPTSTLYAIQMPSIDTTSVIRQYGYHLPSYLTHPAKIVHTLTFHPSQGIYGAEGQDSLSTAEGWQSIAVGRHVYAWQQSNWPSSPTAADAYKIYGVSQRYQVDMSPLITPPIPTRVVNMTTFKTTTIDVPMAVAGSWSGGLRAVPLGLPPGDFLVGQREYLTTGDTSAAITSDPLFVASDPLVGGDPAAVFGVSTWNQPRIEVMDLKTGATKSIGIGEIAAPVADAGALVAGPNGEQVLVFHDLFGNVYQFNLRGALVGVWPSHSSTVQLGVDASLSYPFLAGSTGTVFQPVLGNSQVATVPVAGRGSGAYLKYVNASSPTTVEGSMPRLPWCQPSKAIPNTSYCKFVTAWSFGDSISVRGVHSGPGIVVLSAAAGPAYINGPAYSNGGQLLAAKTAGYVGVLLDVGAQHDMVSWSNSTPVGSALEIWAPVPYSVVASATPSVPSGGTVTVNAKPVPAGVTHDRLSPEQCSVGASPVTAKLTSSIGTSGYLSLTRSQAPTVANPWSTWSISYRLPANFTGKPVTWNGTVSAVDKFCASASATVSFTEEPGQTSPQPSGGPGLTLNPNPAMWSQNVVATLTPSAPSLPSGERLVSWQIDSATLRYPQKNGNWATLFPYYPSPLAATAQMTLNGHSASVSLQENWWDGGCDDPVHIRVCLTNDLYSQGAPGAGSLYPYSSTIPSLTSQVTATYVISGVESHTVISWKDVTDPKTGVVTKVKVVKTVQQPFSVGPRTASAQIVVNGDAKDVVGGG